MLSLYLKYHSRTMRRIFFLLSFLFCLTGFAASDADAYKAVVNIITYDPAGTVLRSGYGFYISDDGVAVAPYQLLEGAAKAEVIDSKGAKRTVERILGAHSTYDLVKFRVSSGKKTDFFPVATAGVQPQTSLNLVYYTTNKKDKPLAVTVQAATDYDGYKYYDITLWNEDKYVGCPLLDDGGNVVAIVQKNVDKKAESACAIDSRFLNGLKVTSTGSFNADLRNIQIQKALPEDEKEALTYIYMMGRGDSVAVVTAMADFIAAFPDNIDIYVERGTYSASRGDYARCEQDFQVALEKSRKASLKDKEAEIHYTLSKLIYNKAVASSDRAYEGWDVKRSLNEAVQACETDTNMLYKLHRGHCLYANKEYRAAYNTYLDVCDSWLSSPETYFAAARALEMDSNDSLRVLALLDSAIIRCPRPYSAANARYLLERAQRRLRARLFREAVLDYNEYEKAVGPKNLTAQFYYIREQAELQARMYQQALDDIRTAASLLPSEPFYRLEEAYILLRVGLYDEAVTAAESILPNYAGSPACHKILGIAYGELGQKDKAVAHLKKARELGDEGADEYLEKYGK